MLDNGQQIENIPFWTGSIKWEPLKGGLSKERFTVTQSDEKFVVRFGQDFPFHHVFRDREISASELHRNAPSVDIVAYKEENLECLEAFQETNRSQ